MPRRCGDRIMTAYEEAAAYISGIPKFTVKNTPETTRQWLKVLGSPDRGLRIAHVAGTNGKGSVTCFLDAVLREAGHSTCTFISPHLVTMRERMRSGGEMISQEDFVRLYERVRSAAEEHQELPHPSYFEFLYLMAMLYFAEQAPDFCILETGLGGRLDATNTAENKCVTVITRIGPDHMEQLGDTIPQIAGEKAGIIRPNVPVITLTQPADAEEVIHNKAIELGAPYCALDASQHETWEMIGIPEEDVKRALYTAAPYQTENAALALLAAKYLLGDAEEVFHDVALSGLKKAHWEGRMEEIRPGFYIDGAHNPDGMRAFLEAVRGILRANSAAEATGAAGTGSETHAAGTAVRPAKLLFSVLKDKQAEKLAEMIAAACREGLFSGVIIAQLSGCRALDKGQIEQIFADLGVKVYASYDSVRGAVYSILKDRNESDPLFAAGSLYLVGEIREYLEPIC